MIGRRFLLVALLGVTLAGSGSAGIFSRKPKPSSQRAGELITILRTEPTESKRASAADELGSYDMKSFPEIVPALLQSLNDTSAEVRVQAVQSLGKLRPVTQEIGMALEQTHASDSSTKVRMQARTTLWQYHLAGYRSAKNPPQQPTGPTLNPKQPAGPMISTTQEPPLADRIPTPPPPAAPARLVPAPVVPAAPPPKLQPPAPVVSRPMPSAPPAPTGPTLVPTQPPLLVPPPVEDLGPSLTPPK